ncbi:hypothetical protein C0991_007164 [Blastosporella zonata]|nr:hypothetical protein C0991_007164 [Blastosporella zonata]
MLRYMKKAESYHLPNPQQILRGATVIPAVHGFNGSVNAGFPQPYEATVSQAIIDASVLAAVPGLVKNLDVASGIPNGVARLQFSIKPGNKTVITPDGNIRSSSANAYVYPSLQVDLPAVGTNLQDQALNEIVHAVPPSRNASEYTIINAPLTPTISFLDLKQVLGDKAQVAGSELLQSVSARAKAIVASGGFTSESGLEKVLQIQANSIVNLDGELRYA